MSGRTVWKNLAVEAGFAASPADRQVPVYLADDPASVPDFRNYFFLAGGAALLFDVGARWKFAEQSRISPFVAINYGLVRRGRVTSEAEWAVWLLSRLQDKTIYAGPIEREKSRFFRVGFGADIRLRKRWGMRFDVADRIEPSTFRQGTLHSIEASAGPTLRF